MAELNEYLAAGDRIAAFEKADDEELARLNTRSDQLLSNGAPVSVEDLRAWWVDHRSAICKWARKLQGYWMTRFGCAALGRLLERLVQVIDRFFQIQDPLCA